MESTKSVHSNFFFHPFFPFAHILYNNFKIKKYNLPVVNLIERTNNEPFQNVFNRFSPKLKFGDDIFTREMYANVVKKQTNEMYN